MNFGSSVLGGIGLGVALTAFTLSGCGGDKSAPPSAVGGESALGGTGNNGGSNAGGTTGTSTNGVGGSAGGSTSTGTSANTFDWDFYADSSGWQTGNYSSTGTAVMTATASNIKNVSYCNGGCADVAVTTATAFASTDDQSANFMYYWTTMPDFTGKTITAKIKLDDPAGIVKVVQLHAQNGSPNYSWGPTITIGSDTTPTLATLQSSTTAVTISTTVTPAADAGSTFDPTLIQGVGFNIAGNPGVTGTAHLYVDEVIVN